MCACRWDMDFPLPIRSVTSTVDYFKPLHVDTNIGYRMDMEKFPEINSTSHFTEPALRIPSGYKMTSLLEEEPLLTDDGKDDLYNLIETLDVDDFQTQETHVGEGVAALFEDEVISWDSSGLSNEEFVPFLQFGSSADTSWRTFSAGNSCQVARYDDRYLSNDVNVEVMTNSHNGPLQTFPIADYSNAHDVSQHVSSGHWHIEMGEDKLQNFHFTDNYEEGLCWKTGNCQGSMAKENLQEFHVTENYEEDLCWETGYCQGSMAKENLQEFHFTNNYEKKPCWKTGYCQGRMAEDNLQEFHVTENYEKSLCWSFDSLPTNHWARTIIHNSRGVSTGWREC